MSEKKFFYEILESGLCKDWDEIDYSEEKESPSEEGSENEKSSQEVTTARGEFNENDGTLFFSTRKIELLPPLNYLFIDVSGAGTNYSLNATLFARERQGFNRISRCFDKNISISSDGKLFFQPSSDNGTGHIVRRRFSDMKYESVASILETNSDEKVGRVLAIGGQGAVPLLMGSYGDFVSDSGRFLGFLNSYVDAVYKTSYALEVLRRIPDLELVISP